MIFILFLTAVFISENVFVNAKSAELIKVGTTQNEVEHPDPVKVNSVQEKMAMRFPKGIVPYYVDSNSYDQLITIRLQAAMDLVEASSCVEFHQIKFKPTETRDASWVHFTNPIGTRTCVHEPGFGDNGEIIVVLGFDCMRKRDLLHAVLHAIGFKDEVTHPHRDQYIRIVWQNIQPAFRTLFSTRQEDAPYKVVEYDPMSIMHFHDRAFSINGGPTVTPKMPGLQIAPSDKLSQLDIMKLRLWFGHECNKRKVGDILENCKMVFHNSPTYLTGIVKEEDVPEKSVNVDNDSYEAWKNEHLVDEQGPYVEGEVRGQDDRGLAPEDGQRPDDGKFDPEDDQGPIDGEFAAEDGQGPIDGKFAAEDGQGTNDGGGPIDGEFASEDGQGQDVDNQGNEMNQDGFEDGGDQNELGVGDGTERRAGVPKSTMTPKSSVTPKSKLTPRSKVTPKGKVSLKPVSSRKASNNSKVKSNLH